MELYINLKYTIKVPDCNIDTLTSFWKKYQAKIFSDIVNQILEQASDYYMRQKKKPFKCSKCGNDEGFKWKTKRAKETFIKTIFCALTLCQMQVQCKRCGKKMFITRPLLEMSKYSRMSELTEKAFALIGSLSPYRVSEKILNLFGIGLNKMMIWRCVQKVGDMIKLENACELVDNSVFEADGTGIPIKGKKKRGKELKVILQRIRKKGCEFIRIVGVNLSDYHSKKGWESIFAPLLPFLMEIKNCMLITDGDTTILKGLKNVRIFIQRCLWHIPHQAKHTMWEDKIKKKSEAYYYILSKLYEIVGLPKLIYDPGIIASIIASKQESLNGLISYCVQEGYNKTAAYLKNAEPDMFTSFKNKLNGKTTSKSERVMKTINFRINVGKWSDKGALNAIKIRLSHYYNGFDVDYDKEKLKEIKCEKIG